MLAGWRADLAALALGAVTALALPPVTLVPALLIGIPGLLALIDGCLTWRGAVRRGFVFGLGLHLAGLYWVTEAVLVEAPISGGRCRSRCRRWRQRWRCSSQSPAESHVSPNPAGSAPAYWPECWVLGDLGRQFALTGFPWNPLGSATEMPGWLGLVFMQPPPGWVWEA